MARGGFWNIPNTLTVLRILLVPVMVWLLWDAPDPTELTAGWFVFVGAMITDIIDGWLARKWDLVSPAGAYLDPLADKLMVTTVLVMMIPLGWVPAWLVVLLLCREIAITGLRGIAAGGHGHQRQHPGQVEDGLPEYGLGFILWFGPKYLGTEPRQAGLMLLYIATLFSLFSATEYLVQFFRQGAGRTRA